MGGGGLGAAGPASERLPHDPKPACCAPWAGRRGRAAWRANDRKGEASRPGMPRSRLKAREREGAALEPARLQAGTSLGASRCRDWTAGGRGSARSRRRSTWRGKPQGAKVCRLGQRRAGRTSNSPSSLSGMRAAGLTRLTGTATAGGGGGGQGQPASAQCSGVGKLRRQHVTRQEQRAACRASPGIGRAVQVWAQLGAAAGPRAAGQAVGAGQLELPLQKPEIDSR